MIGMRVLVSVVLVSVVASACSGSATPIDAASLVDAAATTDTNASTTDAAADHDASMDAATTADATDASSSVPVYCGHPSDCAAGTFCGASGVCVTGSCSTAPCIYGYVCVADHCTAPAGSCDLDADCTGGELCIDGECTPTAGQCFDVAQCASGEHCVAGRCIPGCASSADCHSGYGCDLTRGLCTTPLHPCTTTTDCGNATTVCVAGACIPRSNGSQCSIGTTWVENGCRPQQTFLQACVMTGMRDSCAAGSICIDHSCFVSCDAPNQTACDAMPITNVCKPVTVGSATFNVCGTASSLGNQCGINGMTCSGSQICVDGFCR
jgi:hypothetical protein